MIYVHPPAAPSSPPLVAVIGPNVLDLTGNHRDGGKIGFGATREATRRGGPPRPPMGRPRPPSFVSATGWCMTRRVLSSDAS
jgi:hypothetical protein